MSEGDESYELAAAPRTYVRLVADALFDRRILLPAALLLLVLIATNIVAMLHPPLPGSPVPAEFVAATIARITAICILAAIILRLAAASPRPVWRPDGAFFLYLPLFAASFVIPGLVGLAVGDAASLRTGLIMNVAAALLVSPFAAWIVAVLAERPLAWRPAGWIRNFARWLPQRIGWALLLLVPLGALHSWLAGAAFGDPAWLWPAALADGLIYFLILMIRLGLDTAAYWRVAHG